MRTVSIGIILGIVVLALLGFLFKGYVDNNKTAKAASEELAVSTTKINELRQQNKALESQINDNTNREIDLKNALNAVQKDLPERMRSSSMLKEVLDLCDHYNVDAIPLSTTDWAAVQIEKHAYSVFKMDLQLNGAETDLINFVQALQNQVYPTLVIENIELTQPKETVQATEAGPDLPENLPESMLPEAMVNIAIYAR